jgi:hypothetical protein
MSFQQTVYNVQAYGVQGTWVDDSPRRAAPYILNSDDALKNVVGATAYTLDAEGKAKAGGTGLYLGVLADPHTLPLNGTTAGVLTPTMIIGNGLNAAIASMGTLWVRLPTSAAIGDVVIFNNTTGALSTIEPGDALPDGYTYANANVYRYTVAGVGLAAIQLTPAPGGLAVPEALLAKSTKVKAASDKAV